MNAVALLAIVAIAHLGPDILAPIFGGIQPAWETVCFGAEASALYLYALARTGPLTRGEVAVCLYGLFEAIQRPLFRPFLPMDKPAGLKHGQYMSDIVTGWPLSVLSPVLALIVVLIVVKDFRKPTKVCSSNKKSEGA